MKLDGILTFISELTADLVDSVKATNNKLLEVKLGCDTHVEFHVEFVMVCLERSGCSTTSNLVHHGCLDLKEIAVIKILADALDDLRPCDESLAGGVVHDQIEESVAVPLLLVLVTAISRQLNLKAFVEGWPTNARWATSSSRESVE